MEKINSLNLAMAHGLYYYLVMVTRLLSKLLKSILTPTKLTVVSLICLTNHAYALDIPDPVPNRITLNQLYDLSKTYGKNGIDAWLMQLPEDFRRNFALVYESKSKHATPRQNCYSKAWPRVLAFSYVHEAIIAFGGDPTNPNCRTAEMMAVDPQTLQWQLGEIDFKAVTLTEHKCATCHEGAMLHPIFQNYSTWSGFYGSIDDLLGDKDNLFDVHNKTAKLSLDELKQVQDEYANFKARKPIWMKKSSPGYHSLIWNDSESPSPVYPFTNILKGDYSDRPTVRLAALIESVQARAMAAYVLDHATTTKEAATLGSMIIRAADETNACQSVVRQTGLYADYENNLNLEALSSLAPEVDLFLIDAHYNKIFWDGFDTYGVNEEAARLIPLLYASTKADFRGDIKPRRDNPGYSDKLPVPSRPQRQTTIKFEKWMKAFFPELQFHDVNRLRDFCRLVQKDFKLN